MFLNWKESDFNQITAKKNPYEFVIWNGKEYSELRIIRKDNVGGIITPLQDFSVYCKNQRSAKRLARRINRALRPTNKMNTFKALY